MYECTSPSHTTWNVNFALSLFRNAFARRCTVTCGNISEKCFAARRSRSGVEKRKGAIDLARVYGERKPNFFDQYFRARGCLDSVMGREESMISEGGGIV